MSSQKGNVRRTRPPKYKNQTAFKNDLHDTSKQIKLLNGLSLNSLCERCENIIQWKIKYKKYRPLTQPKICVKCNQKTVKQAYYTICIPCSSSLKICAKCGQSGCESGLSAQDQAEVNRQFESALRDLKERERRTLLRCAKNNTGKDSNSVNSVQDPSLGGASASQVSDTCLAFSDDNLSDSQDDSACSDSQD